MSAGGGSVAFYISGHGFGHASRDIEIINALGPHLPPGFRILVRTAVPRWLFDRTLTTPVVLVEGECDTGVVQIDSLRLDEEATVREASEFYATFEDRSAVEAALLREHDTRLVIADAPPLACAAAAAARVPSVVLSNFTWDWIYSGYAEQFAAIAPEVIPTIGAAYATAAAGWRLPLHGGFDTIDAVIDLPFVARHGQRERRSEGTLAAVRVPAERPVVLSSFGGYGLRGFDHATLDCLDAWTVIVTGREPHGPLPPGVTYVNEAEMYDAGLRYEDLVAAVDVVATKPGYGIISECVANDTAMLYTSRGTFVEYDVMVRAMPRFLRCGFLDQPSLLGGRWRAVLDEIMALPAPTERPRTDGAQIAARMIAATL